MGGPGEQRDYALLFAANVVALLATGLATVALALLAYDIAGDEAGAVLGTALALKMAVNVLVPPFAPVYALRLSRKTWLMVLVFARAATLALLPLAEDVAHIYLLVVVFETAAAAFRAAYIATVPDLVRDGPAYATAIAKARIAYNLETVLSPLLAAALLTAIEVRSVFVASVALLVVAASLLGASRIPDGRSAAGATGRRLVQSFRTLMGTRSLRGALAVNAAAVAISAMVVVNTIVLVRGAFGKDDDAAAIALAAFAAGGVAAAASAPALILQFGERTVMLAAGAVMSGSLFSGAWLGGYLALIALLIVLGATTTLAHLPVESLLRRMSTRADREPLFACRYAIDSAFMMLGYAAAGWVGAGLGATAAFVVLGSFSAAMLLVGAWTWSGR